MCKGPGVRKEDKRENQKQSKCRWSRENNGDCGQEEVGRDQNILCYSTIYCVSTNIVSVLSTL